MMLHGGYFGFVPMSEQVKNYLLLVFMLMSPTEGNPRGSRSYFYVN